MLKLSVFLLSVMSIISNPVLSQTSGESSKLSETVDCGSVTQAELFRRARIWAIQAQPDGKLAVSDKESGDLIVQNLTSISIPRSEHSSGGVYQFRYTLVIECANRKYRVGLHNVELLDPGSGKFTPLRQLSLKSVKDMEAVQTSLTERFNAMFGELKEYVKDYTAF